MGIRVARALECCCACLKKAFLRIAGSTWHGAHMVHSMVLTEERVWARKTSASSPFYMATMSPSQRELGAPSAAELALANTKFSSGKDFFLRTKAALRVELEAVLLTMYFSNIVLKISSDAVFLSFSNFSIHFQYFEKRIFEKPQLGEQNWSCI